MDSSSTGRSIFLIHFSAPCRRKLGHRSEMTKPKLAGGPIDETTDVKKNNEKYAAVESYMVTDYSTSTRSHSPRKVFWYGPLHRIPIGRFVRTGGRLAIQTAWVTGFQRNLQVQFKASYWTNRYFSLLGYSCIFIFLWRWLSVSGKKIFGYAYYIASGILGFRYFIFTYILRAFCEFLHL